MVFASFVRMISLNMLQGLDQGGTLWLRGRWGSYHSPVAPSLSDKDNGSAARRECHKCPTAHTEDHWDHNGALCPTGLVTG